MIRVSDVGQLEGALARLQSGTTVLLAPGEYQLRSELSVRGVRDVAIRGATGRRDDVVIRGPGMSGTGVNILVHVLDAREVLIADVSLGDAPSHLLQLHGESRTDGVRVYNVRLFDAGEQFIKASVDVSQRDGVDRTTVEYSLLEYTRSGPPNGYTAGIDILHGADWAIRQNTFRNINSQRGAPPGVVAWHGSHGTLTDRNTFIDCGRAVVYGLQPQPEYGHSHAGGVISNNMITYTRPAGSDAAISVWDSPDTRILHNTVLLNGTFPNSIEYRYPGSRGIVIANNLVDTRITERDGATARLTANATARSTMFVSAVTGDLHLTGTATEARGRGVRLPDAGRDWDGDPRPPGANPDVGADQFTGLQP